MRFFSILFVLPWLLACGSNAQDSLGTTSSADEPRSNDDGEGKAGDGANSDDGDGGGEGSDNPNDTEEPVLITEPLAECDAIGEERPAEEAEAGNTCVCSALTLFSDDGVAQDSNKWVCYGPDDSTPPAGGARGAPPAECKSFLSQPGEQGCLALWAGCSDGHSYMVSCQTDCWCLIDSVFSVGLPPQTTCPTSLDAVNEMCGWNLEGEGAASGTN
jgi:hypothetical protein